MITRIHARALTVSTLLLAVSGWTFAATTKASAEVDFDISFDGSASYVDLGGATTNYVAYASPDIYWYQTHTPGATSGQADYVAGTTAASSTATFQSANAGTLASSVESGDLLNGHPVEYRMNSRTGYQADVVIAPGETMTYSQEFRVAGSRPDASTLANTDVFLGFSWPKDAAHEASTGYAHDAYLFEVNTFTRESFAVDNSFARSFFNSTDLPWVINVEATAVSEIRNIDYAAPVPEPQTYLLFFAGLGVLGVWRVAGTHRPARRASPTPA